MPAVRELVLRRPLDARVALEAIILAHRSLVVDMLHNRPSPRGLAWLVEFRGKPAALDALRQGFLDRPPRHVRDLAIVREGRGSILTFGREVAGGTLGISRIIVQELGARTLMHHEKSIAGCTWTIWTQADEKVPGFVAKVKRLVPEYEFMAMRTKPTARPDKDGLSPQERAVVSTAVQMGYYEQPRRVHLVDIARALNMPKATVHHHLARGESRIVGAAFHEARAPPQA